MSHVTDVEVEVLDLDCLTKAAEECGCELVQAENFRYYAGNLEPCSYVIRDKAGKAQYEIGVVETDQMRAGKRVYGLKIDNYNNVGGLGEKVGMDASKLTQRYALNVAKKQLRREGRTFRERTLADGRIQLVAQA